MLDVLQTPEGQRVTLANATAKFVGYSSILLAADYLLPGLYTSLWPLFATVVVLTVVGSVADLTVVPLLGNIVSLLIGAEAMVLCIYCIPLLWPGGAMTLTRAVVLTICIAPLEYALHQYVLRQLFPRRL